MNVTSDGRAALTEYGSAEVNVALHWKSGVTGLTALLE